VSDADFYKKYYSKNLASGPVALLHGIAHRTLESDIPWGSYDKVLEVGSNNREHFEYVKHDFLEYYLTDIKYPETPKTSLDSKNRKCIEVFADVHQLPFADNFFDRIIVTCVLHHLGDPNRAIRELRRCLSPDGTLSIHLSGDPSILYRLLWKLGSKRNLKKLGVPNPDFQHAIEHIGNVFSLEAIIFEVFKSDRIRRRSFPFSWQLLLFRTYQIQKIGE
jgi:phosphatidylethanolamine/phosphatidyl-N-methylethanolamine N-methyltransferase